MPNSYRFIIVLFGNRHQWMLLPLFYSIINTNPRAGITLFWEEIDKNFIVLLKKCFPQIEFIETNFHFGSDITKRISSKTAMWEYALRHKPNENLVFIDADTLVIKDISNFFLNTKAEIIFTVDHQNKYPINTGVLLCYSTLAVQNFFVNWLKETQTILNTPKLYQKANDKNLSYGGADQMSFQKLLKFEKNKNSYQYNNIFIEGISRDKLNETNSVLITENTHIIHYKGGWNDILFKGYNFTKNRNKQASWEMYIFYLRCCQKAIIYANKFLKSKLNFKQLGIYLPFYLNPKTLQERAGLYPLYCFYAFLKSLPWRIQRFFHEHFS